MTVKLAVADYSFPKLEWEKALRLAKDLGVEAVDIGLFAGRSHLRPEELLSQPARAAARVSACLDAHGLKAAGIFGQAATNFEESAVNHPDASQREKAAGFFWRLLEFTVRCNTRHMTLLPGAHFSQESYEDSLKRSAEELAWRVEAASRLGVVLSVEPHVGSVVPTPSQARQLADRVPGLTLALDYSHFTCQGIADDEISPLLSIASHVHVRGSCKGKLQATVKENTIDYARIVRALQAMQYPGYVVLEYVWMEWMRCNEVDILTETIELRDLVLSADR